MIDLKGLKQIHCIGVGGVGLSAIAEILLSRGNTVSGSDMKESEITDRLIKKGAYIYLGHREKNVEGADLVIYSAAISSDNPELMRASELGIPILTRAEALGMIMQEYSNSIAISGTHGKTTTTSMVSLILNNAGKNPTILVGGNLSEIGGNVKVGNGDCIITEACEYMDSFLSLRPKIEIILNIDSDHLDYFKDIDHIVSSFEKFATLVPEDGLIIAYDANPFVKSVVEHLNHIVTFGYNEGCDYYVEAIDFNSTGRPSFWVCSNNERLCRIQLAIPGEHNILNSLAAFACAHKLGVDTEIIKQTLEVFTGTGRRFDILGVTSNNVQVVDDYAHHPTEIKATLDAATKVPHKNLWCLFQPHTYTRTIALFDEFAGAFQQADKVVISEIYAAREKNIYKISSKELVQEIKKKSPSKEAYYFKSFDDIADFVYNNAEPGDLVLTMGAGDIYKVGEMILEKDGSKGMRR
ncbi:MAG: UDP-N-acetylmuramate--L-alanine ligase [Eubacteriales bacterium]|nr:UDP-N-acetylmuramate--L-alanine ligase [Eubacteriales bacterium]MDD4389237.1 UDP-N-acetylmuramate--L-alanine ligase [Eubacteriales bacterium]